jgi:hypothetical protein
MESLQIISKTKEPRLHSDATCNGFQEIHVHSQLINFCSAPCLTSEFTTFSLFEALLILSPLIRSLTLYALCYDHHCQMRISRRIISTVSNHSLLKLVLCPLKSPTPDVQRRQSHNSLGNENPYHSSGEEKTARLQMN